MRMLVAVMALVAATACTDAPRLLAPAEPEAPPQPVRYVALGDSLATGAGAQRGYAERYAERLEDHASEVQFVNLSFDGWTSGDLLAALRDDPRFAEALADADEVTINIGGNDLLGAQHQVLMGQCGGDACLHQVVDTFGQNWDAAVAEIDALVTADTQLVTMDIYNPFVAPLRALGALERLTPFLDRVNDHIRQSAAHRGMPVAPVHATFNGADGLGDPVVEGLIADDRLHPSDDGHAVIADLLVQATQGP